mmetsp:Transcript_48680/g.81036  ORF Transcript_48680/g.81036 Transcript_48680/m.81036 type:complete len:291 (+) Transcript_48680:322-1194(+)|eukprot:CAMPEP_0184650196 /NCGR_PEP_ID=MMETSP0308-20130426/7714_1 /TAXON_ID=38269 /ORGANISM="Gloeochaete witrockiana, Strain SAG 46.84" /LENGTH=290 /DNA_ID=CAMNT_0027083555 /DNA_START=319 /DNA_END=1191 /DNA_ORIENTATION=-
MVQGTLHVKVGGCRKLKDTELFGRMDPYIIIRCGNEINRTSTKKDAGRNPVFNESFKFDITPSTNPSVSFVVKDSDVGKDDFVGEVVLNFGEMAAQNRTVDSWYVLKRKSGKDAGEIQLKISFQPYSPKTQAADPAHQLAGSPYGAPPPSYQAYAAPPPPSAPPAYPMLYPAPSPVAQAPTGYPTSYPVAAGYTPSYPSPQPPAGYPPSYPPQYSAPSQYAPQYVSGPAYAQVPVAQPTYVASPPPLYAQPSNIRYESGNHRHQNQRSNASNYVLGGAALGLGLGLALGF